MANDKDRSMFAAASELRGRAENVLKTQVSETGLPQPDGEMPRILHELQVHQIELEMQNAELRHSRDEAEVSLERYTDLYDFSPVSYLTLDCEGIVCSSNLTAASLLGVERSRLTGRRFGLFVADESRLPFSDFIRRVFASHCKESCEVALTVGGDSRRYVRIEAIVCGKGQECRIAVIDITEKKQQEERLRLALEAGQMATWDWHVPSGDVVWNDMHYRMMGYEPGELQPTYQTWAERVHPDDIASAQNLIQQSMAQRRAYTAQFRSLWPDGTVRWLEARGNFEYDNNNQPLRCFGVMLDFTDRKLAEQERQKFVSLADNSTEFIGMCDLDLVPFYINENGMRLVGIDSLEEACTVNVLDFFYPEDRDSLVEEFFPRILKEGHGEVEIRFRNFKTGKPIWMIYNVFYIRDNEGHPVALATVSRDITPRKQAEERLYLLSESASLLLAFDSPRDVIETICIKAMTILDCHAFFNYLMDEEKGCLRLNACAGIPEEEQRKMEWLDTCATVSDCAARNPSRNRSATHLPPQTELVRSYDIMASACYPLMTHDEVLGTLSFVSSKNRFSEDDLSLMKALADQIAVALERTRNAQSLKKSHERLEQRVAERTTALANTVNVLREEIVEREKAEQALEKSAHEIEDLYNLAPCGYHSLDRIGQFVRINDTELQWLGYDRNEIVGKMNVNDVLTPESRAVFSKSFTRLLENNTISDLRVSFMRKDGSVLPVLLNASAVLDDNDNYIMCRSTIYDITELVRAEENIRNLNRLYLTLSETGKAIARLPDRDELFKEFCRVAVQFGGFRMVWVGLLDDESGVVRPAAAYGYGTDYLENVRISARPEPDGMGPTGTVIRFGGHYISNDFMYDPATGPWRLEALKRGFLASASFAITQAGVIIGAITMYAGEEGYFDSQKIDLLTQMQADISFALDNLDREARRRDAERGLQSEIAKRLHVVEELRIKEQMLLQQSRLAAMGEMINNIAHQWRQPLNVLGLLIQQMRLFYDMGTFNKEYVDSSVNKSMSLINHMSQTIDDFRNFYKPDKEKSRFAIHEVVTRTLALVEDSFKNQQIGIEFHANANPEVFGFPNEYSQALLNILMNAKDALLERYPADAKVTVTISSEGEKGVVTIVDNAGGIAEDIIGKIFDPYFTTKGPQQGTGVGLFMSKAIIENNMGGRLTVRNITNGAEFRVEV